MASAEINLHREMFTCQVLKSTKIYEHMLTLENLITKYEHYLRQLNEVRQRVCEITIAGYYKLGQVLLQLSMGTTKCNQLY